MSSTTTDEETRPPSSRATSVGFELDLDQMEERDIKQCLLSDTIQRLVLPDWVSSPRDAPRDGRCILTAEVRAVDRSRSNTDSSPGLDDRSWDDEDTVHMVNTLRWRGFTVYYPSFEEHTRRDSKHDGQSNGNLEAAVQRFHLLIRIMQGRRTAQGLTDARELESLLLQADHKAYEKESCTSLREYLMLARQAGLPLKFSGEATATIQHVWFKGRRDLQHAIERYTNRGSTAPVPDERAFDPNYLVRLVERYVDLDIGDAGLSSDEERNKTTTMPRGGARAWLVERHLLDECPRLYATVSDVRSFQHYLMHMRTRGAPIKFSKDQYNAPTWIFLQAPQKAGSTHGDSAPGSQQQSMVQDGHQQREMSQVRICIPAKLCPPETEHKRFLPLIQAIKANVEAPRNVAEAAKVLDTLERLDAGIFARERCSGLKQLLKIARVHGIDVCWQQFQGAITDIGLSEASMASLASPHFHPRGVDLKF